jgi:hypothetical protein
MKITVDGHKATLPFEGADHVVVDGACPKCKGTPFTAKGQHITHHDHDTYYAHAICCKCGAPVGQMKTVVSTIFGIEEDERVLFGRCRVY